MSARLTTYTLLLRDQMRWVRAFPPGSGRLSRTQETKDVVNSCCNNKPTNRLPDGVGTNGALTKGPQIHNIWL